MNSYWYLTNLLHLSYKHAIIGRLMIDVELLSLEQRKLWSSEQLTEQAAQSKRAQQPAAVQLPLWDPYLAKAGRSVDVYQRGVFDGLPVLPDFENRGRRPLDYTRAPETKGSLEIPPVIILPGNAAIEAQAVEARAAEAKVAANGKNGTVNGELNGNGKGGRVQVVRPRR